MYCNKCGNKVNLNQQYCNKCGNTLLYNMQNETINYNRYNSQNYNVNTDFNRLQENYKKVPKKQRTRINFKPFLFLRHIVCCL